MRANYTRENAGAEHGLPFGSLLLHDVGPWDKFATITNAAEEVVLELNAAGELREGRRVFYTDSEGRIDEILVKDGRFVGFRCTSLEPKPITASWVYTGPKTWIFRANPNTYDIGEIVEIDKAGREREVCCFGDGEQYYPTEGKPPEGDDRTLMLAAPEMLDALKRAGGELNFFSESPEFISERIQTALGIIREAIAKGEPKP